MNRAGCVTVLVAFGVLSGCTSGSSGGSGSPADPLNEAPAEHGPAVTTAEFCELYDPASDANNNFHAFATGEWIDAKESLLEEGNARLASLRLISPPTEIAEDWAAVEGYWLTYIDLAAALPEGGELDGRPEAPVDSFNALIDYTVTNCP